MDTHKTTFYYYQGVFVKIIIRICINYKNYHFKPCLLTYIFYFRLNGKVSKLELMDMRARLLLNIGVVQEYMGSLDKAIDCINKAITICSNQDLYEILHNCYTTEALIHSNKRKDYAKALGCLNKALEVASRLENKVRTKKITPCIFIYLCRYQSIKLLYHIITTQIHTFHKNILY